MLPHERTFSAPMEARLDLIRAVRAKLSPIFLLHAGPPPAEARGEPDAVAVLGGVTSRLWRVTDPDEVAAEAAAVSGPLVIADGHHRYEAAGGGPATCTSMRRAPTSSPCSSPATIPG